MLKTMRPSHSRTTSVQATRGRSTTMRRFAIHYLEMVVAMVAGMVILGSAESLVFVAAGRPPSLGEAGVGALVMASNMVVAMAGWMRFRGHTRAPILEMSSAMYLPFLLLLMPLEQGKITEGTFMVGGHVLMLLGMLLAMMLRREEYTGHHGH
jgi:hypothetical protein